MSEHKRNKPRLNKKISSLFKGVPNHQNVGAHKPCGAPEQQRAIGTEPELPAPEPQVPQTAKPQMKRTFQQHGLFARFNKRKAKAMAKAEEKLRAAVERKVKAEAEMMLLTQHRRYSVLAERAMAQARDEIAAAKAQVKEKLAKAKERKQVEMDLDWLKTIPTQELIQRNAIEPQKDRVLLLRETLKFYGLSSGSAWKDIWAKPAVAARRSQCFETCPGPASAWIRLGEIQAKFNNRSKTILEKDASIPRFCTQFTTYRGWAQMEQTVFSRRQYHRGRGILIGSRTALLSGQYQRWGEISVSPI